MRAEQFLRDYFSGDENFIIAIKVPPKKQLGKNYTVHKLLNLKDAQISKVLGHCYYRNKDEGADIYFTLNTYKEQKGSKPTRKEDMVSSIKSFYFDIDKEVDIVYPKIIEMFGEPTYKITSSKGKYQLIYKFKDAYHGDILYFKQLLKGLVYHFHPIDKLFDTARIFRLVGYMNKKQGNEDFLVKIEKNENYYSFERFEAIAKPFILEEQKKQQKLSPQRGQKQLKSIKVANDFNSDYFDKYKAVKKKQNKKYNELLAKYKNDKSTTDLAYVRWLRRAKKIEDKESLILKVYEARGYEELMQKHGYQIDYYFENIIEKSI